MSNRPCGASFSLQRRLQPAVFVQPDLQRSAHGPCENDRSRRSRLHSPKTGYWLSPSLSASAEAADAAALR
jgi:hypothetical protein